MSAVGRQIRTGVAWVLAALAVALSLHVWAKHAPLYFDESDTASKHAAHLTLLSVHIMAATPALFAGPIALWSGLRRRFPLAHRRAARVYLTIGTGGIIAGLALAVLVNHRPTPNFNVGLWVLGAAWLGAAAMAWRAVRNGCIDSHREWMIRSYALTWSFVVCRLPDYPPLAPVLSWLGAGGDTTILWVGWVVPMMVIQVWLEWERGTQSPFVLRRRIWEPRPNEQGPHYPFY